MTHTEACTALASYAAMFASQMIDRNQWYGHIDRIITELEESVTLRERERAEAPVAT